MLRRTRRLSATVAVEAPALQLFADQSRKFTDISGRFDLPRTRQGYFLVLSAYSGHQKIGGARYRVPLTDTIHSDTLQPYRPSSAGRGKVADFLFRDKCNFGLVGLPQQIAAHRIVVARDLAGWIVA